MLQILAAPYKNTHFFSQIQKKVSLLRVIHFASICGLKIIFYLLFSLRIRVSGAHLKKIQDRTKKCLQCGSHFFLFCTMTYGSVIFLLVIELNTSFF